MMYMRNLVRNIKRYLGLAVCTFIGGCWLGLHEWDNYYLSFEGVDGIVVESYGTPATTTLQGNSDRPLNYRLERPLYTLYIRHYERNYLHPQYTLQAISHDGEELTIDYLIPHEQWQGKAIYCYNFKPSAEQYRREQLGTKESIDKTRVLIWMHFDIPLQCRGGAKDGPLNRIDLALFDSNGALVAEERLPVAHVKNGVGQSYDY